MGMVASASKSNDEMVDNLIKTYSIKTKSIELSFRLVDRRRFLPKSAYEDSAYKDSAWRLHQTGLGPLIHLSAPSIYATVLENLNITKGLSFLNIGSGTGYLSTIIGFLLGNFGINHGVELYENLLEYADQRLQETLNTPEVLAFEWCIPQFFFGNAFQIKTNARYDRIYCNGLVPQARRSFFCNMLKVNGILIMPYADHLLRVVRVSEKHFACQNIVQVRYSNLIQPTHKVKLSDCPITLVHSGAFSLKTICRKNIHCYIRQSILQKKTAPLRICYKCVKNEEEKRKLKNEHNLCESHCDPQCTDNTGRTNYHFATITGRCECYEHDFTFISKCLGRLIRFCERIWEVASIVPESVSSFQNSSSEQELLDNADFELAMGFRFDEPIDNRAFFYNFIASEPEEDEDVDLHHRLLPHDTDDNLDSEESSDTNKIENSTIENQRSILTWSNQEQTNSFSGKTSSNKRSVNSTETVDVSKQNDYRVRNLTSTTSTTFRSSILKSGKRLQTFSNYIKRKRICENEKKNKSTLQECNFDQEDLNNVQFLEDEIGHALDEVHSSDNSETIETDHNANVLDVTNDACQSSSVLSETLENNTNVVLINHGQKKKGSLKKTTALQSTVKSKDKEESANIDRNKHNKNTFEEDRFFQEKTKDSDDEMMKKRKKDFKKQATSLANFKLEFYKRIDELPLMTHLLDFLKYHYN